MFRRGRSRRGSERGVHKRRPAFAFAALLAVFLQAFIVQTHIHAPIASVNAGVELAVDNHEHATATRDHRAACSLCQALAAGGAAPLPSVTALIAANAPAAPEAIAYWAAPRAHSHSWRSRAPPSFL
jgi:hypothetical protein